MWQRTRDALEQKDLTLIAAESCTAGLLAHTLSQAEGAGDRLRDGFVTYTKDQKRRSLGVDATVLEEAGPVRCMAKSRR